MKIATRGGSETRYTCLAVGDFHARSRTLLAPIITEEVHVVYFRIVFVLILKHDLRHFSGYLILHDWAGGGAFSLTATGNRASLILYRAEKLDIIIRNCYYI